MASVFTAFVALFEAVTVIEMIPGFTIIDAGALIVTGFLAGLFAGMHMMQAKSTADPN